MYIFLRRTSTFLMGFLLGGLEDILDVVNDKVDLVLGPGHVAARVGDGRLGQGGLQEKRIVLSFSLSVSIYLSIYVLIYLSKGKSKNLDKSVDVLHLCIEHCFLGTRDNLNSHRWILPANKEIFKNF